MKKIEKKQKVGAYSADFRAGALQLVREGRSVPEVAEDLGIHAASLYNWLRQARVDAGEGTAEDLTTDEKLELATLRKEVRVLKMEREILKKAAAFFAKENA
jgi:transposase